MKRDRGLDLKNKVKALKWNTSFLCLNVIGATYHNGQDTKWSLCLLLFYFVFKMSRIQGQLVRLLTAVLFAAISVNPSSAWAVAASSESKTRLAK